MVMRWSPPRHSAKSTGDWSQAGQRTAPRGRCPSSKPRRPLTIDLATESSALERSREASSTLQARSGDASWQVERRRSLNRRPRRLRRTQPDRQPVWRTWAPMRWAPQPTRQRPSPRPLLGHYSRGRDRVAAGADDRARARSSRTPASPRRGLRRPPRSRATRLGSAR